jgi:peptidoglycan hydrolase-like protein with peptidoglycan-binding domain
MTSKDGDSKDFLLDEKLMKLLTKDNKILLKSDLSDKQITQSSEDISEIDKALNDKGFKKVEGENIFQNGNIYAKSVKGDVIFRGFNI